jgi:hypothetical protein
MFWILLLAEQGGVLEGALRGGIRGAIIGGIVGAIFGLVYGVMRLRKKKDGNRDSPSEN